MSVPAVEEESEVAVFETRLARECVRELAVETSCDCRLFEVSFAAVAGGLVSVFSRRNMPPTAY